jgi:hypothetical protein
MQLGALALAAALLAAAPARAVDKVDKEAISAAVQKGVKHLQTAAPTFDAGPGGQVGLTALIGLTLLECDVPIDDPSIQRAAAEVRRSATWMDQTYSIALSILFLDRLGEPVDVALIESLTVRLLGGQSRAGAWTYSCPKLSADEQRRLTSLLERRGERGPDKGAPKVEPGKRKPEDLPPEIRGQLETLRQRRSGGQQDGLYAGDNSNTQFAILGLWVARRYGLPVDGALELAEKHFRATVNADGGWGYVVAALGSGKPGLGMGGVTNGAGSTPAMTCAGLLGIGFAYAAWNESALRTDPMGKEPGKPGAAAPKAQDPSKDPLVQGAFRLLGSWVDAMGYPAGKAPQINHASAKFYYFLWSLERVAVAYNLEKIGHTDWYHWGAGILLTNQGPDGGWNNGEFRGGPDTCFALLVLKRANLAKDLTRSLTTHMKGNLQSTLKSGGGGGGELSRTRKPFFDGPAAEGPPDKVADSEAAKLGEQLTRAGGGKREQLLEKLRDGKGAEYTQALASAIKQLEGDGLKKARDALAERMARMTSDTLSAKLDDDDPEVRRAAALAVAMKEDKAHALKLIDMLDDREQTVSHAAHAALKSLADDKVDFGPPKGAGREDRRKAALEWRTWWLKQLQEK